MDKWTILLIRTCKSVGGEKILNTFRRILGRRSRMPFGSIPYPFVAEKLFEIVQKYNPDRNPFEILSDISPEQAWKFGSEKEDNYWIRLIAVLTCRICMIEGVKLEGYIPHAAFRNQKAREKA